jgi:hypothetical protein
MSMRDKVSKSLSTLEADNLKMRAAVRRAVADGRWAAATDQDRQRTKRAFGINLARRRELIQWLAKS